MRAEHRDYIQERVVERVLERQLSQANGDDRLETLINDTLYHERQRLERCPPGTPRLKSDRQFYAGVPKRLRQASEDELRRLLEQMTRRFVGEIVGKYNPAVYRLSTHIVPAGLTFLLRTLTARRLLSLEHLREGLTDHLVVQGEVERARKLLQHGTLIVTPTHLSNLDSVVLGYGVYLAGLPPLLYGAGINLFANPLLSFFMRNLGAYRVDRKKRAPLYKEILKEYATVALQLGYHNLFFPGGTRSRSGAVEQRLKKGLLGTGLRAYIGNLKVGAAKPNIYVVPATLSYKLVLEAETLIDDYLQETGKSRYIIVDDESSRPRRVAAFLYDLISLHSKIVLTLSAPTDLFGNPVDANGQSHDLRGRPIDVRRYVCRSGKPHEDPQRDHQYTNELADGIAAAFRRDNVVMSTHLVAHAIFSLIEAENPSVDLYRLLRTGGKRQDFSRVQVCQQVERTLAKLASLRQSPRLGPELTQGDAAHVLDDALGHFATYHKRAAAVQVGERIRHQDRNLLLYYKNRLTGYDLAA